MNLTTVLLALLAGVAMAGGLQVQPLAPAQDAVLETRLLLLTNDARAAHGLPPVAQDARLSSAARRHALEMAELSYLDHQSPVASTRTLAQRLDVTGILLQASGENIALISPAVDVARLTVDGWLASPGHRATLLGDYTHVGFGTATNDAGDTYVVQVMGYRAVEMLSASVEAGREQQDHVAVSYSLTAPGEVAFWLGNEAGQPEMMAPGNHTYVAELGVAGPVHINSGVRQSGAGRSEPFIAADAGWFDPANGSWIPSDAAHTQYLRISGVQLQQTVTDVLRVQLELASVPSGALGLWVDDAWIEDFSWDGRRLAFSVPVSALGSVVQLGFESGAGSNSYMVAARLKLVAGADGQPGLVAQNPG